MAEQPSHPTDPGWYVPAADATVERWWDGRTWMQTRQRFRPEDDNVTYVVLHPAQLKAITDQLEQIRKHTNLVYWWIWLSIVAGLVVAYAVSQSGTVN